jgi:hypothetical protein
MLLREAGFASSPSVIRVRAGRAGRVKRTQYVRMRVLGPPWERIRDGKIDRIIIKVEMASSEEQSLTFCSFGSVPGWDRLRAAVVDGKAGSRPAFPLTSTPTVKPARLQSAGHSLRLSCPLEWLW